MTRHRTLISGFAWCYNSPVLSSNKLTLNCMRRMAKLCAYFTVILTFQRLHYYYSAQFQSFHYKFYICHLIAVLLFCNTSLIWRLLLFFGANTVIWPAMRKRSLLEFPRDLEFLPEPEGRGLARTTAVCRDMWWWCQRHSCPNHKWVNTKQEAS